MANNETSVVVYTPETKCQDLLEKSLNLGDRKTKNGEKNCPSAFLISKVFNILRNDSSKIKQATMFFYFQVLDILRQCIRGKIKYFTGHVDRSTMFPKLEISLK
jgi:hypothetical protein